MRVCLQPMDFMQISTIASLHSIGLLCPTKPSKPSKRAVHGAVSPCPDVHAGAFLRFMGIISTVSRQIRYALTREHMPPLHTETRDLRHLRCGKIVACVTLRACKM